MKKHIILFALLCMTLETMQAREISSVIKKPVNLLTHILENRITNKEDCYFNNQELPNVKVYWGNSLPRVDIIEAFETGDFCLFDWQLDGSYPWSVTTTNPYEGMYCMKSGGAGVANVVSNMTVTVNIPANGQMSFYRKISCENNWDHGYFYIDGVQKGIFTGFANWAEMTYDITAGNHTFQWRYTKDGSGNSNDDCFYVDYICFYRNSEPIIIPTVTTFQVTDIQQTTATGGGNVTSDGGASVTERGICWSTSHNPTTNGSHASSGSGTGSFSVNMTGLTPGTTYYVRAYATNSAGTAYGNEVSFITVPQNYTINVSANPSNGGTVSGGGTYPAGQSCTVSATANNGYVFTNWTENGNVVSTSANYTFTVTGNRTLVAHFIRTYTINVSASPFNGGTVTGGGTYQQGQPCTVSATAYNGYVFTNWTENGNVVSTSANYTFTVNGNRTLVANFQQQTQQYTISVSASPTNGGTVSGGGTYEAGQSCTVSATANPGFIFFNWKENGYQVSTSANYTFIVNSDRTLVAHFQAQTFNITASADPTNGGNVSGGGTYNYGATCTLTATPASGFNFINWTKDGVQVSTNQTFSFTVTSGGTYIAHFSSQNYIITAIADPSEGGTVSGGGGFNYGDQCTLRATANTGYTFVNWTKNGEQVSTNPTFTFNVTESATYVAHFQAQTYTITATADPANGGNVSGGGTYNHGATCTLTATANTGYRFVNWTKNGQQVSTSPDYSFTVTSSGTYVAHFQIQTYTITATADPTNGGNVSGGGTYNHGATCTLTATAHTGYQFVNWTKNGQPVSSSPTYSFTVTSSGNYVAHFTQQQCTITVSASPIDGGSVYVGNNPSATQGTYNNGESCTVHARANSGFTFVRWTENNVQVSTNEDYTFMVDSNRDLVAHFTQQQYVITAEADPPQGGHVEGSGGYDHGEICELKATPNEGYDFINWTKDGVEVTTDTTFSFEVIESATYVAYFRQTSGTYYTITLLANPVEGGTVTGGGTYLEGSTCRAHATANPGYAFTNWTENGNIVSTSANLNFTVNGNRTLEANFVQEQPEQYTITVSANPTNGGSVYVGDAPGTTQSAYTNGQDCTVHARANTGYNFVNWTENGTTVSTEADYTFQVTDNRNLVAHFTQEQPEQYTITVHAEPTNGGTVTGGGIYNPGETVELKAIANNGYTFDHWQDDNTQNPRTITVTGNATYTAFFIPVQQYTINTIAEPEEGGIVEGDGQYYSGSTCTLHASANEGYYFVKWTKDGSDISDLPDYSFLVTENATYKAHFFQGPGGYTISVRANPEEGGNVTGSGTYAQDIPITVTATANEGYKFTNWTENGVIQCLTDQYEFDVNRNRVLVANFEQLPVFTISATAGPNANIDPQGDVQVVKGSDATFTIRPDFGFFIAEVLVDGNNIGQVDTYTFANVDSDHTISVSVKGYDVEEHNTTKIKVYPNPAKEKIFVEGDGLSLVNLYDLLGNCLRSMNGETNNEMSLSGITKGVYVLMIETKDNRIRYQKLIVAN